MLSEESKVIGGKKGVCMQSVETFILTSVWFWIVCTYGASRPVSTFQGLHNTVSEVDIRNMKAREWQRSVRMGTATDSYESALFSSEGAC